jgi:nucleoside-diphosphate-sugar epimerase
MSKVLVTGGSGFIGSHLVAALAERSEEITCLVRPGARVEHLSDLGARLVRGDVTDRQSLTAAVAGQEVVYHLAGCTAATSRRQFELVNVQGTRNVATVCAGQNRPPTLVAVSTLAVAGPALDGRAKTEYDPPAPVSHYGRSKLAGELALLEYADRVPTTIVRPPIVLGEHDRVGLPLFRSIARWGIHLCPDRGKHRFSLIHAADLARLLILAAERGWRLPGGNATSPAWGQGVYYAACGEEPTYADLGRMVGEALGRRRVRIWHAPLPLVWSVAAVGEAVGRIIRRPMVLNLDKAREIAAGSWFCSARTATEQLSFAPAAPLPERLRQTADWYRREGWLKD